MWRLEDVIQPHFRSRDREGLAACAVELRRVVVESPAATVTGMRSGVSFDRFAVRQYEIPTNRTGYAVQVRTQPVGTAQRAPGDTANMVKQRW
jgi:hypothetical protein